MKLLTPILAGAALAAALLAGPLAAAEATVGIAMPTKTSARWIADGNNMVEQFKAAGYNTDLQYANDDIPNQLAQIENMITKGVNVLVIAAIDGTTLYVGIERANRLVRFDFRNGGIQSRAEEVAVPPAYRRLPNNEGPEALMFVPSGAKLAGALIVLSERGLDAAGNILGFLIGGPSPGEFAIKRTDGYDISDAALLPDGDIVLLERKFSLRHGVGIRVRRIAIDGVKPGATIDGPTLMEADLGYEIDNMEGIDAHRTESGETVLTLISDDNFSFLQRTLILQFTLIEP